MKNLEQEISRRISSVIRRWFYTEPLLFSLVSRHSVTAAENLKTPLRTGQLRVEYNPLILQNYDDKHLNAALVFEMMRVLLGHPYARQNRDAKKQVLFLASDVTVYNMVPEEIRLALAQEPAGISYLKYHAARFQNLKYPLGKKWHGTEELAFFQRNLIVDKKTERLVFQDDLTFEQWYRKILFLIQQIAFSGGESAGNGGNMLFEAEESSSLWEDNQEIQQQLGQDIKNACIDGEFGESGGNAALVLGESGDFAFDYRKALTKFRAKIVSADRYLTRMRPSRRYGFSAMGSRYKRRADILIAVDVSGSITEESFSRFYKAVCNFFFLGIIEKMDLIFFDVNIRNSTPVAFKNSRTSLDFSSIKAGGGTSFQPPYDYYAQHCNDYSGMIIFTDGQGRLPVLSGESQRFSGTVLWILESRSSYEKTHRLIESLPGSSATYLPF